MKLIVGLGNPGDKYKNTRHNVGFMIVDYLCNKYNVEMKLDTKLKGFIGMAVIGGEKTYFLKPVTYMNLSGESIQAVMHYYKIDKDDFIVIYDDLDIEKGDFKIKAKGSSGGHNGIKSIIQHMSTQDFNRIKVGIKKDNTQMQTVDYVLGRFTEDDLALVNRVIESSYNIIDDFIKKGSIIDLMNKYN